MPRWRGNHIAPDWEEADGVDVYTGLRADGLCLVRFDLDSHEGQNAQAALATLRERAGADLVDRLALQRSTGGQGFNLLFLSRAPVTSGTLWLDGAKVGEAMGIGSHGRAHVDRPFIRGSFNALPILTGEETAALLAAAGYRSDRSDRAQLRRIGESLLAGYERFSRPDVLARFLVERGGVLIPRIFDGPKDGQAIGRRLWLALLCGERSLDRSAAYGTLAQSLALHVHLSGLPVAQRWALMGKIAAGAPRDDGSRFTIPFWARNEQARAEVETAAAPRPAHRPVGDKERMLTALRRELKRIPPDAFGLVVFTLAELQDALGRSRRSVQGYLAALVEGGEISRPAQVNGNGPLSTVLLDAFGGGCN